VGPFVLEGLEKTAAPFLRRGHDGVRRAARPRSASYSAILREASSIISPSNIAAPIPSTSVNDR
jgi:hypothetical protein